MWMVSAQLQNKKRWYALIHLMLWIGLVLEEQPDNLDVMMSLATVYEEQGNEDAAIEIVEYGKFKESMLDEILAFY